MSRVVASVAVRRAAALVVAAFACGTEAETPGGTSGVDDDTAVGATSGSSAGSSGAVDVTTETPGTGTTAVGSSDDTGGTTEDPPPPPPPPEPVSCDLAVVDPAADPTMVIDAGDGVGQIPTVIGEVLLRNCGCHYNSNMLMPSMYIDYISDKQPMSAWSDFHGNFMGTFPMGYSEMPAYLAIEQRVVFSDPLPMPPMRCGAEGEEGTITVADLVALTEWFAAGAPDGASWPAG